jgi:hypothetical protein
MQVEGITWHALTLEPDKFTDMKKLCREVLGLAPMMEEEGWALFAMPNGTMLDLFEPDSQMVPSYGLNDGIVFGFRVDDVEAAADDLRAAGCELLCDILIAEGTEPPSDHAGSSDYRKHLAQVLGRRSLEKAVA